MALHCTECGFVNAEGANYCQRCGALLPRAESAGEPATATYRIDETGELVPVELDEVTAHGPALVIRAGGGRVGRGDQWYLDDLGSLNGTYVNRSRIESQRLEEGDEVQIGKYKLTFHVR